MIPQSIEARLALAQGRAPETLPPARPFEKVIVHAHRPELKANGFVEYRQYAYKITSIMLRGLNNENKKVWTAAEVWDKLADQLEKSGVVIEVSISEIDQVMARMVRDGAIFLSEHGYSSEEAGREVHYQLTRSDEEQTALRHPTIEAIKANRNR